MQGKNLPQLPVNDPYASCHEVTHLLWAIDNSVPPLGLLYKHQVITSSSGKFSLKHTFKEASSLILGNQLSLYFSPFKCTHLCAVYVWRTLLALSFSLLPTEKWKNVTTAGADSKAYEPYETRWGLTASAHTDS